MRPKAPFSFPFIFVLLVLAVPAAAQDVVRDLKLGPAPSVDVKNDHGRVAFIAIPIAKGTVDQGKLTATSPAGVIGSEIQVTQANGNLSIEVVSKNSRKRIDLVISIPERAAIRVETSAGAVDVSGNFASVQAKTDTGTTTLDVPTDDLRYQLLWTESRPRFVADFELAPVKERSAGRFEIRGTYGETSKARSKRKADTDAKTPPTDETTTDPAAEDAEPKAERSVAINITTARGIILLNVPPNEVGSDLRERPLTNAAKAIVRSGDSLLMEAIRRAAPRYYGDYARSLPPYKREPTFAARTTPDNSGGPGMKQALVRVADLNNRAIVGLGASDFEVTESGSARDIISVAPSTAPFNLVLLLDVSGSVENYVNFIRKAARNFVETVDKNDRVSIIIFNEDVKVLSTFTTDKSKLSESLDTFDAGGGTAYYDALAYTVADTLRPLRGQRTAIVILTDGDDNRSFLAFDSLIGSIQESGALIYPLYVPSGLIALAEQNKNADIDPMRKKYMSLTAKSEGEGDRLAKVSGGVYYPITQISQIQKAYQDIVLQLRTAYVVTYRSESNASGVSPRLKIKVKRDGAYTTINSVEPAK